MKIRVLGCSGAIAKDCRTTSFLIDGDTLIDAGTGVGDLTLDEMCRIERVFLTHSHLDHIAALPLMVDSTASRRRTPLQIHALAGTIDALKTHIFNDVIWPDFSQIPSSLAPFISFHPLSTGQSLQVAGKAIEVMPAVHTVRCRLRGLRRQRLLGFLRRYRTQSGILGTPEPAECGHAGDRNSVQQPGA